MPSQNKEILYQAENINFAYDSHSPVFTNANITIYKQETLGIYGENGSGKSTLFKIITQQLSISTPITRHKDFTFDLLSQNEKDHASCSILNVKEYLLMHLICSYGYKKKEALFLLQKQLKNYHLSHLVHQQLKTLSGGQLQQILLLKTLLSHANVLFLDEPLHALDEQAQVNILSMIQSFHGKKSVVLILHDLQTLQNICDRILICKDKQLLEY